MSIQTYDPSEVSLFLAAIYEIKGYSPDSIISISKDTDYFSTSKGAFGNTERVRIEDKTHTLEITLSQTSPTNSILNGLATLDQASGRGRFPIFAKDSSGQSLFLAGDCWIQSAPVASYTTSNETRTWIIRCADMVWGIAGNDPDDSSFDQLAQIATLLTQFGANKGLF